MCSISDTIKKEVDDIKKLVQELSDDYPGHKEDVFRSLATNLIIDILNKTISQIDDGSRESYLYFLNATNFEIAQKMLGYAHSDLQRKELAERSKI